MLATLVRTLPEGLEWEYEVKLDGYRLEAIKNGDRVLLYSRRGSNSARWARPVGFFREARFFPILSHYPVEGWLASGFTRR
jgi:ATP-dependent DNA ligase